MSKVEQGFVIHFVADNTPPHDAGLLTGDRVLRVNGRNVTDESSFHRELHKGGQDFPVVCVLRDGKEIHAQIRAPACEISGLVEGENQPFQMTEDNPLDFSVPRKDAAVRISTFAEILGWLAAAVGVVLVLVSLTTNPESVIQAVIPPVLLVISGLFLALSSLIGRAVLEMASATLRTEKIIREISFSQRQANPEINSPEQNA